MGNGKISKKESLRKGGLSKVAVLVPFAPAVRMFRSQLLASLREKGCETKVLAPDWTLALRLWVAETMGAAAEDYSLNQAGISPLADIRRSDLESKVQELGLRERVRFLGYLPHDSLLDLYRYNQVDAVVLPSVDLGEGINEGIPVALIEAMAFGYPVVATATGGIPELLREGAGLLVPDKSSRALAEAISQLLTDETLREELARRGRQRVEREFSVGEVVKALINLWGDASA